VSESKSFLLATWEGGGSVAPILTIAKKLLARGHRVRVISDRCNQPETEAYGASFVPWTRAPSRPDRSRATEIMRDWEPATPQEGFQRVLEGIMVGPALAYAEDLIEELEHEPADLVVTNEMLFGVPLGCEAVGQKFALVAANVSLYPMPGVPPLGPGLAPPRNAEEEALHRAITEANTAQLDSMLPALNAARTALGLAPLERLLAQLEPAEALLLATARVFDFAPPSLPPRTWYVGPQLGEPAWATPWVSPWPADDRRPLVLVGFSTSFQDHIGVLQRLIDAAAPLPVRLLVTLGDTILPSELTPAPNARLVHSAPHDAVMREAAVVVTHGGHGTVSRALTHRRPLLVVPHGRDQNDNAVRVTERGAGLSLPATASVDELRGALARLLTEPGFAEAADRLGAQVHCEAVNSPIVGLLETMAGCTCLAAEAA
jgi:MGT family glycosyltransferase